MPTKPRKRLILLVNLGTPEAPTPGAVRRFLSEFLHDRRVVDLSRWLWCPLLHGIILPLRAGKVARAYARIWLPAGSPLRVHSQHLAENLQHQMPHARVRLAMRYGQPSVSAVLDAQADIDELVVLPLYPQYSGTTTATVFDAVSRHYQGREHIPHLRLISDYHRHPAWLDAIEARIRSHWDLHGQGDCLLLSFHGIPQRFADRGDPYARQCQASAEAIAARLGLGADQWRLAYQSRFGREAWLQPYTDRTLRAMAEAGMRRVDVICPGFAVDCLETLEEIAVENRHLFQQAGGTELNYISALNDEPGHVAALKAVLDGGEAGA